MKQELSVLPELNSFPAYKQDRQKVILEQLGGFSETEKKLLLPVFLAIGAEILEDCKKCIAKAKMTEYSGT